MLKYLFVSSGAAVGGVLRYWMSDFVHKFLPATFPFGTLIVNVLGCFILGVIMYGLNERGVISQELKLFLTVGFCGGFTTFSTFSLETVNLMKNSEYTFALVNIVGSVVICIAATFLAYLLFSK